MTNTAARKYYKNGARALIGGVPVRLAFPPSANVLSIMREGVPPRGNARDIQEQMAESYARWLAARDGVSLRAEKTIKAIAVWKVPEGKSWRERRVAAVRFEAGRDESRAHYSWQKRGWNCEQVLATIAIPNWDHEPRIYSANENVAFDSHPAFA